MKIVDLMKESDLSEFEIEQEGLKLRICRGMNNQLPMIAAPTAVATGTPPQAQDNNITVEETGVEYVKSPMVGTFYSSPSPDAPTFTSNGDKIKADSVTCIIEAMKVMNEIQAEVSGTIIEALVENGETVEFGQPLFKVKVN